MATWPSWNIASRRSWRYKGCDATNLFRAYSLGRCEYLRSAHWMNLYETPVSKCLLTLTIKSKLNTIFYLNSNSYVGFKFLISQIFKCESMFIWLLTLFIFVYNSYLVLYTVLKLVPSKGGGHVYYILNILYLYVSLLECWRVNI